MNATKIARARILLVAFAIQEPPLDDMSVDNQNIDSSVIITLCTKMKPCLVAPLVAVHCSMNAQTAAVLDERNLSDHSFWDKGKENH